MNVLIDNLLCGFAILLGLPMGLCGDDAVATGAQLARVHCAACHLYPAPDLLDKKTWRSSVLPAMAPHLGLFEHDGKVYPVSARDRKFLKIYPEKALIKPQDWQKILDYYEAEAPEVLPLGKRSVIKPDLALFTAVRPKGLVGENATCVKIDPATQRIWVGLESPPRLEVYDPNLKRLAHLAVPSAPTAIVIEPQTAWIACIGRVDPHDSLKGEIVRVALRDGIPRGSLIPVVDRLARPVTLLRDGDSLVVGEFGHRRGRLSRISLADTSKKTILLERPGAIALHRAALRTDQEPVLLALMTQADESIWAFPQDKPPRQLLRFPPVYGTTWFEPADFNNDGLTDFVVTCGDNADFSPVFKPYHGVYIFQQQEGGGFEQAYFFPMHGAFKALARDFDGDGDLDIAAIATFADYQAAPEAGFVLLACRGGLAFEPRTIPAALTGRWLTMDAADVDSDGDTDLVLGNFPRAPHMAQVFRGSRGENATAYLVLRNRQY